jgi:hypothetical protein
LPLSFRTNSCLRSSPSRYTASSEWRAKGKHTREDVEKLILLGATQLFLSPFPSFPLKLLLFYHSFFILSSRPAFLLVSLCLSFRLLFFLLSFLTLTSSNHVSYVSPIQRSGRIIYMGIIL